MKKIIPSKEQEEVFKEIKLGKRNIVVSACAGSGKTTTLLEALKRIDTNKSVLFIAFNKSIANELKKRVPKRESITVSTVHSYGVSLIKNQLDEDSELENTKYRRIISAIFDIVLKNDRTSLKSLNFNELQSDLAIEIYNEIKNLVFTEQYNMGDYIKSVLSLTDLGRMNLIDNINHVNGEMQLNKIKDHHKIMTLFNEVKVAWKLTTLGLSYTKLIDYTDMVSMPYYYDLKHNKYDFVFVDECQDINNCQRSIMEKSISENGGRFIAVGDKRQAIYGFTGADHESYRKLVEYDNTVELPLSTSYRCHKQIVEMVLPINPDIRHSKGNEQGTVKYKSTYDELVDEDMVLCRNTKPLVELCLKLLSENKKATIIGSDIGLSLIRLIRDAERKREEYTMVNVMKRLNNDINKLVEKTAKEKKISLSDAMDLEIVTIFREKVTIIDFISGLENDPNKVIDKINKIFRDNETNGILLSTIHKSKGLESDRVFILMPQLMPSKYAVQDWEIEQENNLTYVAYTRAKRFLGFIRDMDNISLQEREFEEIVESEHVGTIGSYIDKKMTIVEMSTRPCQFRGTTTLYKLEDENKNLYTMFGQIKHIHLIDDEKIDVGVGDEVKFRAKIKKHNTYRGEKSTQIAYK